MSVIIAFFQAIVQAITTIFPVSESGHSALFHDFSNRFTNACSQLTGIVHIGIAFGIVLACLKLFANLSKTFFVGWLDLFKGNVKIKNVPPQRKFMNMTILSFALMLFYFIPVGNDKNLYTYLLSFSYDKSVLSEGIFFALTGIFLLLAFKIAKSKHLNLPSYLQALILGIVVFFAVPISGCSLVAGILAVGIIVGITDKTAFRYAMVMSVPTLLAVGIAELCLCVTKVTIITGVVGFVVSAVVSFLTVRLLNKFIKNGVINYFAIYDVALGVLCIVIGAIQIAVR